MVSNDRSAIRLNWVQQMLGKDAVIDPLAGDGSFRCYFRIQYGEQHYVLMDAPPQREDVRPFLAVRSWFERAGLRVSSLQAESQDLGFLLLEDFGNESWASYRASGGQMKPLFQDALRQLHLLQDSSPKMTLPIFDMARMQRECDLYLDWYLPKVVGKVSSETERQSFHAALYGALKKIEALPRLPVHLDYHSRNLMLPQGHTPLGQIDYQDAVMGPVTYDLASLLYDCYQDYPEDERRYWSRLFFAGLPKHIADYFANADDWHQCLRLTALQRHIKVMGIFARLAYRDGKTQFLNEMPLTKKHLREELTALDITLDNFSF
ncbi:MAG: phosphotransferase [Mariprofundus sp.]|nr:phosphotransferase [Mariprofundus sp.]